MSIEVGLSEVDKITLQAFSNSSNTVQVTQVSPLQEYKKLQKVAFNEEQAKKITDQLAIDEQSKLMFKKRVLHEDYYLDYDYNPLLPGSQFHHGRDEQKKKKESKDLFSILNKKEKEKVHMKRSLFTQMEELRTKERKIQDREYEKTPFEELGNYFKKQEKVQQKKVPGMDSDKVRMSHNVLAIEKLLRIITEEQDKQISFEEIVEMKDENFFQKNLKIDNLFFLVFNRDNELKTGIDILNELRFCNSLVKDSTKKMEMPIPRDISNFARKCIRNQKPKEDKSQILQKNNYSTQGNLYDFNVMMNIASGRTLPSEMIILLNQDSQQILKTDDSLSVIQNSSVIYNEERNVATDFKGINEAQHQEHQLQRQPLTPAERQRIESLKKLFLSMGQCKQDIEKSISLKIMDKKTLSNLEQRKAKQLMKMVNQNSSRFRTQEEKIRFYKIHKNRDEVLNIKALTEAMKEQNKHQTEVKKVLKKKKKK